MRFWSRPNRISESRLIEAAETIAQTRDLSELEQVQALVGHGFETGEAARLVALLPIAFSRPVLEELGIKNFVTKITAVRANGEEATADLLDQPEYIVALRVARKHRRSGVMDDAIYRRITEGSSEIDAVCNAVNNGEDIRGGTIASCLIGDEIAFHLIR